MRGQQCSAMIIKFSFAFAFVFILLSLPGSNGISPESEKKSHDIVIGKTTRMYSEILKEWRPLEVYLPGNYESSKEPYPIMLVLDGGWAFRYCVSLVDMMSPNHLPGMIVIGIPNTDRGRDLEPVEQDSATEKSGAYKFLRFLRDELIPFLGKEYRTRDYRILVGHSLAGMYTAYALLKDPGIFDAYIASSPGFQAPRRRQFLEDLLKAVPESSLSGKSLYFSAGGEESPELHEGVRNYDELLKKHNNTGLRWSFDIFEGEGHVPVKGFYQGLRDIFSKWIPTFEFFANGSLEDMKIHYGKLTERFGYRILPPSAIINSVGWRHLRENQPQKAVEVFKYLVSVYPESSSGFRALGNSYIQTGQKDLAVKSLKKALEIDPKNSRAKKLLSDLTNKK